MCYLQAKQPKEDSLMTMDCLKYAGTQVRSQILVEIMASRLDGSDSSSGRGYALALWKLDADWEWGLDSFHRGSGGCRTLALHD